MSTSSYPEGQPPELEEAIRRLEAELAAARRELTFLQQDLQLKEKYLAELRASLVERDRQATELQVRLDLCESALAAAQSSLSWRITSPLRSLRRAVRRWRPGAS